VGTVLLPRCGGKRLISEATGVFTGFIDRDFIRYDTNEPGDETPETRCEVYDLVEDADYATMFGSIADNVETICLTQDQIITFCENNPDALSPNGVTFFPFKSEKKVDEGEPEKAFFVADVGRFGAKLEAGVGRFEDDSTWYAEYGYRVVVPLAP